MNWKRVGTTAAIAGIAYAVGNTLGGIGTAKVFLTWPEKRTPMQQRYVENMEFLVGNNPEKPM